jgi:hypothetical protein
MEAREGATLKLTGRVSMVIIWQFHGICAYLEKWGSISHIELREKEQHLGEWIEGNRKWSTLEIVALVLDETVTVNWYSGHVRFQQYLIDGIDETDYSLAMKRRWKDLRIDVSF